MADVVVAAVSLLVEELFIAKNMAPTPARYEVQRGNSNGINEDHHHGEEDVLTVPLILARQGVVLEEIRVDFSVARFEAVAFEVLENHRASAHHD